MASIVYKLQKRGLINPPSYVVDTQYEVLTGSISYGVNSDMSDCDIVGFCIPSKEIIFPHLAGEIFGFGIHQERFNQFQQHHIADAEAKREYDITVYNIIRFFQLCMENNPNMIDSLFVPHHCILHITKIGDMVRDNRKDFLHKGSWYKFKGYAYSMLHKIKTKKPEGKRRLIVDKFGFDVKFAYHVVRLLDEIQQILETGDLDLERCREKLKAIRAGEIPFSVIETEFYEKEKQMEALYHCSKLQHSSDETKIKLLLLSCFEEFYGSINNCVKQIGTSEQILKDLSLLLKKYS